MSSGLSSSPSRIANIFTYGESGVSTYASSVEQNPLPAHNLYLLQQCQHLLILGKAASSSVISKSSGFSTIFFSCFYPNTSFIFMRPALSSNNRALPPLVESLGIATKEPSF